MDGIELDVQVTQDGIPVLFHPRNLPAGAPAKTIAELTLADLNKWNATLPEADRIRSLLDSLNIIPLCVKVIVDLKSLPAEPLVDAIVKGIPKEQWKRLVFYSTDKSHLDYLESKAPSAIHFEAREITRTRGLTQILANRCELPNSKDTYVGFEMDRDVEVLEKLTLGDGKVQIKANFLTTQTVVCTRVQVPKATIVMIGINTPADYDRAMLLGAQAVYSDAPLAILAHRLSGNSKEMCGCTLTFLL